MTRYEKILLLLLLLFLGFNIAGFAGGNALFDIDLWVLAISYLLGSYWLFNRAQIAVPIRIIAGFAFAAAIISFIHTSNVKINALYQSLPALNGLLCVGLGIYLLLHRREAVYYALHGLWLRAVAILIISFFFAYCPLGFWPYRKALIAMNYSQKAIVSNLRMFDYRAEYDAAMDRQDYHAAVAYGYQALEMGKRWLGGDSVKLRRMISGTYTNLYTAYKNLGDGEYNQHHYQQAFRAYQAGNTFLVTGDHRKNGTEPPDEYWQEEKAWSLNNMAFCYLKLRQFAKGDALFIGAIRAYKKVYPTPDLSFARLAADLATSYTAQRQFNASTQILQRVDRFLTKDTTRKAATVRVTNAMDISMNYMQQDSLSQALHTLQTIAYPRNDTTANRYKAGLEEGVCLYKMERYRAVPAVLQQPLGYYKQHARYWEAAALCQLLLAKNSLALAQYAEVQQYADATRKLLLTEANGANSSLNSSCLSVLGALNKTLGKYAVADKQLTQAVAMMHRDANNASGTRAEALTELADLDVTMGRVVAAQEHVSDALALLLQGTSKILPSQTAVIATAAYVDYVQGHFEEAHRKYRQIVAVNARYGEGQKATTASAWNGLGLVEMAQHHYGRADSLFQQALDLHEKLFTAHHPLTATVYLNYGLLRLKQNRNSDARLLFEKASGIAQVFLPADHDMFGDLAMAMGDLAAQEKRVAEAHNYYEQAVAIYAHKFPATHWKVKDARRKAGA